MNEVWFEKTTVKTDFDIRGTNIHCDGEYRSITMVFTEAYNQCLKLYSDKLIDMRLFKIVTNFFVSDMDMRPYLMKCCFKYLKPEYMPLRDYEYCADPCVNVKKYFAEMSDCNAPSAIYYVNNTLQLCVSILDYICDQEYMLKQCPECGDFFIATHGRSTYCCEKCRLAAANRSKRKSAATPLHKAWIKAHKRIHDQHDIKEIDINSFDFDAEKKILAERYITDNDKASLLRMLREEYELRRECADGDGDSEDIIKWLDKIARKQ